MSGDARGSGREGDIKLDRNATISPELSSSHLLSRACWLDIYYQPTFQVYTCLDFLFGRNADSFTPEPVTRSMADRCTLFTVP